MSWKEILGSVSPAYGMIANKGLFQRGNMSPLYGAITGEGEFGKMLNPNKEKEKEAKKREEEKRKMSGMKKGGSVKPSRGDGCAIRGKTKGRMV
jgi:hypothetical protein